MRQESHSSTFKLTTGSPQTICSMWWLQENWFLKHGETGYYLLSYTKSILCTASFQLCLCLGNTICINYEVPDSSILQDTCWTDGPSYYLPIWSLCDSHPHRCWPLQTPGCRKSVFRQLLVTWCYSAALSVEEQGGSAAPGKVTYISRWVYLESDFLKKVK